MRNRTWIEVSILAIGAIALFVSGFLLSSYREAKKDMNAAKMYEVEVANLQATINELASYQKNNAILEDSLPLWRERDKEMLIKEMESISEQIEFYDEIRETPPSKVDKVYQRYLKELVRKYRNDELRP